MRQNTVVITIGIWLCFPVSLYALLKWLIPVENGANSTPGLFGLYLGLTWSIALLIFLLETTRQQLFSQQAHRKCAGRLGLYGLVSAGVSLIFTPMSGQLPGMTIGLVVCVGFLLAAVFGSLYWRQL